MVKPLGWTGVPPPSTNPHGGNPHLFASDGHLHRLPSAHSMTGGWAVAICPRCGDAFVWRRVTDRKRFDASVAWLPVPERRAVAWLRLSRRERRMLRELRAR